MSHLVYKTTKKALTEALPIREYIEKKRNKVADALAEAEIAFTEKAEISKLLKAAELKLRAARDLAAQAGDDMIGAVAIAAGGVPEEGAQIEIFAEEAGGYRIVVHSAEMAPDEEGKALAPTPIEAAIEEAEKGTNGEAPPAYFEADLLEAETIFKKISTGQRAVIVALRTPLPVFMDDLEKGQKQSARALQRAGIIRDAEGETGLVFGPVGFALNDLIIKEEEAA